MVDHSTPKIRDMGVRKEDLRLARHEISASARVRILKEEAHILKKPTPVLRGLKQ